MNPGKTQAIHGWTKETMIAKIKSDFKGKSVNSKGVCVYRGPEGKKCAVGIFIPDEKYASNMENWSVFAKELVCVQSFMPLEPEQMRRLQYQHDSSTPDDTLHSMLAWIENTVE